MAELKQLVNESGLKKTYIVNELGISFPTYYKKIANPSKFTGEEIFKLKELIGKNIEFNKFINFFCKRT